MRKKLGFFISIIFIFVCFFYPWLNGEAINLTKRKTYFIIDNRKFTDTLQYQNDWELPFHYAQTSWPAIHRDSRNSNFLPFITTDQLTLIWKAIENDYAAVITPLIIGPEGNLYFTTGKEKSYGNLHAFDNGGNELWRSYLLDSGAFISSPIADWRGDLYIGDSDEFFSFHPDGTLKWKCSGLDGPFASTVISQDGYIISINRDGLIYVFDPETGRQAAQPLELPGQSPGEDYKIFPPPGLWKEMVHEMENLTISDIYNAYTGHQFKITKAPAVNPKNTRIYVAGSAKSSGHYSSVKGRLYGLDFFPGTDNSAGQMVPAFEKIIEKPSGTSPCISPDGKHIYLIDKKGTFYTFNEDGQEIWRLFLDIIPSSPAIGPNGTIYVAGGSTLIAVNDLGSEGAILWEIDFNEIIIEIILNNLSGLNEYDLQEWIEKIRKQDYEPALITNSKISASKNYLYLTFALGYEMTISGNDSKFFVPVTNFLLTLKPSASIIRPYAVISSFVPLPDTAEGVLTLGKDGTVYCTHASIGSSVADFISKQMGFTSRQKPIGGISVLGPKNSSDLICSQIECTHDSLNTALRNLRSNDLELAYAQVLECKNQLKCMEEIINEAKNQGIITKRAAKKSLENLEKAYLNLEKARIILEQTMGNSYNGQRMSILQAQLNIRSAVMICKIIQILL